MREGGTGGSVAESPSTQPYQDASQGTSQGKTSGSGQVISAAGLPRSPSGWSIISQADTANPRRLRQGQLSDGGSFLVTASSGQI